MEGILSLILLFLIYFLPTIIAEQTNKKHHQGILILNLFLGWTVIAWVICLVWAVESPKKRDEEKEEQND